MERPNQPSDEPRSLSQATLLNDSLYGKAKNKARTHEHPDQARASIDAVHQNASRLICALLDPAYKKAKVRKLTSEQMTGTPHEEPPTVPSLDDLPAEEREVQPSDLDELIAAVKRGVLTEAQAEQLIARIQPLPHSA